MDRREQLRGIFWDTEAFLRENRTLAEAVEKSRAGVRLYAAETPLPLPEQQKAGAVAVTKARTFEAAIRLRREYPAARIAVLNFASAVQPGGGVKSGCTAQEESLCRCSTLYPTLDQKQLWDRYYLPNRAAGNRMNTDVCIWSPGVVICKTDESFPQRLPEEDFVTVDVITCAAPDLRYALTEVPAEKLYALHLSRARRILQVAAVHDTDCLVLGAFGCGAFLNDPTVVSAAWEEALSEARSRFERVEFAIYCRDYETENYRAFRARLG